MHAALSSLFPRTPLFGKQANGCKAGPNGRDLRVRRGGGRIPRRRPQARLFSPAQISQTIKDFEAELGTALFFRSTRNFQITARGAELLPHFQDMLRAFEAGMQRLGEARPSRVRISAPTVLAGDLLADAIATWSAQNPGTQVQLDVSDAHHARAASDTDLFIRFGGPEDDLRTARLVGRFGGRLMIREHAFPVAGTAEALRTLPLIVPAGLSGQLRLVHERTGETIRFGPGTERFVVNNTSMIEAMIRNGAAAGPVFSFQNLNAGEPGARIVDAAPGWIARPIPLRILFAAEKSLHSTARAFADILATLFERDGLQAAEGRSRPGAGMQPF